MKEIPESLQHYIPRGRIPNRPWWKEQKKKNDKGPNIWAKRSDGISVEFGYHPSWGQQAFLYAAGERTDLMGFCPTISSLKEALAEVDRRYPLPRPRGRFGQVWCVGYNGNEPIVYVVTSNYEASYFANNGIFLLFDPAGEYYASPEK